MKKNSFFTAIGLITAVWFSACTNDELVDDNTLPEGKYPLEIASVTMNVESSSEPWDAKAPQTRVTESEDRNSSVWQNGDKIKVQIGSGAPGTYTYQDGSLTVADGDAPAYWASKNENQSIRAWYTSSGSKTVELVNQTEGLAYVLIANATANFDTPVSLAFTHALAKVRVVLSGTQFGEVENVVVNNYTTCTHTQSGSVTGGNEGWITMHKVNATTYEANVVPVTAIPADFIHVNGQAATISNITALTQGEIHTINLTAGEQATVLTADNCTNITGEGNYIVSGNFQHNITITGGNLTIYLENANISVNSGNAIDIMGGNPTIHVVGTENNVTSGNGAGIFVAENNIVTITGSSREDKLTVRAGGDAAAIGGYATGTNSYQNCGAINISNVTVEAYGGTEWTCSPGIGSVGNASSQTITIDNAIVYAFGTTIGDFQATPGIGCGHPFSGSPNSIPTIVIKNESIIHAHRGDTFTDYIGWADNIDRSCGSNNTCNFGTNGFTTNSTVYCYTGNGNIVDKTMMYDADGNVKVQ